MQTTNPPPTRRIPTHQERKVFNKCIYPSIKYRNEGKVAECCQAYFSREMIKADPFLEEHLTIMETKAFRKKFGIIDLDTFLGYLDTVRITPKIGGEHCIGMSEGRNKIQEGVIADLQAKVKKSEDDIVMLRKRIENIENSRDYQLVKIASGSCHTYAFCLTCMNLTIPDDEKLIPLYENLLNRHNQSIEKNPLVTGILPILERKVDEFYERKAELKKWLPSSP